MLDPKLLRHSIEDIAIQLKKRGFKLDTLKFNNLEQQRKELQITSEELQNKRNSMSKSIGQAKGKGATDAEILELREQVTAINEELSTEHEKLQQVQEDLQNFLSEIPNLLHGSVPEGDTEESNLETKKWGTPKHFNFKVLDHVALGENLKQINFTQANKIAGSRFVVLHKDIARMQRALAQFMLDTHTREHGYQETYVPFIIHERCLYGNGQFPKFREDVFAVSGTEYYLTPTAEAELANLLREEIVEETELPIKFTAHTPCFRSEAGSYGKDTRGMIRQHQFEKVELFQIAAPDQSEQALEEITKHAETILQLLELPYRVIVKCAGDTGFSAIKTYDLEVWLPAQDSYREISSCSNCGDFQARRLQLRYRGSGSNSKKVQYAHTLNGSGLAVGRTLVAVLENYQQADGSIAIPSVLQPYMHGQKLIKLVQ